MKRILLLCIGMFALSHAYALDYVALGLNGTGALTWTKFRSDDYFQMSGKDGLGAYVSPYIGFGINKHFEIDMGINFGMVSSDFFGNYDYNLLEYKSIMPNIMLRGVYPIGNMANFVIAGGIGYEFIADASFTDFSDNYYKIDSHPDGTSLNAYGTTFIFDLGFEFSLGKNGIGGYIPIMLHSELRGLLGMINGYSQTQKPVGLSVGYVYRIRTKKDNPATPVAENTANTVVPNQPNTSSTAQTAVPSTTVTVTTTTTTTTVTTTTTTINPAPSATEPVAKTVITPTTEPVAETVVTPATESVDMEVVSVPEDTETNKSSD